MSNRISKHLCLGSVPDGNYRFDQAVLMQMKPKKNIQQSTSNIQHPKGRMFPQSLGVERWLLNLECLDSVFASPDSESGFTLPKRHE